MIPEPVDLPAVRLVSLRNNSEQISKAEYLYIATVNAGFPVILVQFGSL